MVNTQALRSEKTTWEDVLQLLAVLHLAQLAKVHLRVVTALDLRT